MLWSWLNYRVDLSVLTLGKQPSWPIPSLQNSILISTGLSNGSRRICPQRRKETYSFLIPPYSMPISYVLAKYSIWEQRTILWDTEKELVCSSQGLTLGQAGIRRLWRHVGLCHSWLFHVWPGINSRMFWESGGREPPFPYLFGVDHLPMDRKKNTAKILWILMFVLMSSLAKISITKELREIQTVFFFIPL